MTQSFYQEALDRSLDIREKLELDFKAPVDIYQACDKLGLALRLDGDVSMEGIYIGAGLNKPTVILSTLRPLARRHFTCAHELGHHVFGDGAAVDEIMDVSQTAPRDFKEIRADTFAGHLLMPTLGVSQAFTLRGWRPAQADPTQVFAVASNFAVGYTTLIRHMQLGLGLISDSRATTLLRTDLPRIRRSLTGRAMTEPLTVVDEHFASSVVDVEVGYYLLLPPKAASGGAGLDLVSELPSGSLFRITKAGVYRAFKLDSDWAVLVRASRPQYHGLARYRHLEDVDDDESA